MINDEDDIPFNRELFEKRYTVDLEDGVQYMNPKVWADLNRLWTQGPTWRERWTWFWMDVSDKWDALLHKLRMDDDEDYDDI